METHEIDMRLQRYTAAEHRIGANLQELEQHSVYQLLSTGVLTGKTAAALRSVTDADPNLWELYTLLSSALDRARRIRGPGNRLGGTERQELAQLLGTPSILIASEDIPLSERGLTGESSRQEHITFEALIARMSSLYEPIRDVITHAETALRGLLPRLNSAEATMAKLRDDAVGLGVDTVELDRIDETIARIRDLSLTDPLAIPTDARAAFDHAIHEATATIARARSSHAELATDIAGAAELLDECRELIEVARQSKTETLSKIAQPIGLRTPPSMAAIDGPQGLAARLEPIISSTQPWQIVRRLLDEWSKTASRLRDQLHRVAEANALPLQRRDELRGRLTAFRAKMAATGFSEDLVLRDISAEAHNELFTSPTDLARAEKLVTEFGARLAAS